MTVLDSRIDRDWERYQNSTRMQQLMGNSGNLANITKEQLVSTIEGTLLRARIRPAVKGSASATYTLWCTYMHA